MASERIQRRIERLLDQIEEAADNQDWNGERTLAEEVLSLDPDNIDAQTFLAAAQRSLSRLDSGSASPPESVASPSARVQDQPTSFSNGRYQVKRSLGEGGKKKVYLATDTLLDRDVASYLASWREARVRHFELDSTALEGGDS